MCRPPLSRFIPLLLALCLMAGGTASAQIKISFVSPESNQVAKDFELKLNITSEKQLGSVRAEFAGKVIPMPLRPDPAATISIDGVPYGQYPITVTVRDSFGLEAQASRLIQVDRPPRLVVQAPRAGAVARLAVRLTARCEDDAPTPCEVKVVARILDPRRPPYENEGTHQWSGLGVFDEDICLSPYVGKQVDFSLQAYDGKQYSGVEKRFALVNDDTRLSEVLSVPGTILDYDEQRVLFVDEQQRARVMDRASGNIETLVSQLFPNDYLQCDSRCGLSVYIGHLIPGGAFFLSNYLPLLVQNGQTVTFEYPDNRRTTYRIAGRFLVHSAKSGFELRDLSTGTMTPLQGITDRVDWLDENGSILWASGDKLWRYQNGRTEVLSEAGGAVSSPTSDGDDVVFNAGNTTVLLHGGQRYVLADTSGLSSSELGSRVKRGWVAFVRPGGGVAQVWTRSPAGVEQQVSSTGLSSNPIALEPDGTVVYKTNGKYVLAAPGAPQVEFSLSPSNLLAVKNGVVYRTVNGSLFRLDPTGSNPVSCPAAPPPPGNNPVPPPPGNEPAPSPPEETPVPRGWDCTAAGDGSAWLFLLPLLSLGLRRARRL